MPRILIVFGTTDGHTAKIASALGDEMRTRGVDVVVREPYRLEPAPDTFDAVVVAASVHGGRYQSGVTAWVQGHVAALNRRPSAFVSVSLGILQHEPEVQAELRSILDRFLQGTGWNPTRTFGVAGALLYTQYWWLKRWMMRRIAAKAGGDTDTTRDYIYTDWPALRAFAGEFVTLADSAPRPIAAASA
jgi:menaquinone-dependent protoporphyrinogen oxidase